MESFCPVCEYNYNEERAEPVCLSCGHTFCRRCLLLLEMTSLMCPKCRIQHNGLPVSELPVVFALYGSSSDSFSDSPAISQKQKPYSVMVRDLHNEVWPVSIKPQTSVYEVKEIITSKTGIDPKGARLCYQGKPLDDRKTMEEYEVGEGHTLQMTASYIGGSCTVTILPCDV